MSSAGSSPSSPPASPLADSTGGRRIGKRTKYVAPAASRIPRLSSSIEPVEFSAEPLELLRRAMRRRCRSCRSGGCGVPRPASQRPHQEKSGDNDRETGKQIAGEIKALLGGGHE